MVREVRGTGTLAPEDLRWIPAIATGRVDRIRLHPGARVEPETIILDLTNPDLDQQVDEAVLALRTAEAGLANRRVELESALLTTEAAVAQLDSDAHEARLDADAEQLLRDKGLTSAIQLRTKKTKADNLEQRAARERVRLELQRHSRVSQLAIQEAEVARQRAVLRQRQTQRDSLRVRAGVAGVLQQVAVELGASVGPGTNLARVVDPTRLKAELKIPETQANDVQVGQRAAIDTRNGIVLGRVARIDPAATGGTVTVDVLLEGELPKGARPDLTIDGTIELERLPDVVYVGRPALGEEGGTIQLFRLAPTGEWLRVPVTVGRVSVNLVEVRSGLSPGDQVILSDMSQWDAVGRVRVK
ncbi:MAG: efflux RND transporter periplasmic adaptor subunit [Vicinamibacterales bacterium]|nr:efflux RND transporter periplasmic adaptor subunit [Vicinamibacterales bacterium]